MFLPHSRIAGIFLALALAVSLIPAASNSAGAAGEIVEATVRPSSSTYNPNDRVSITIDLQNNDIRRMRATVRLTVSDPDGTIVRERTWRNVRTSNSIQLQDDFALGTVTGEYTVGLQVTDGRPRSATTYVDNPSIATFGVLADDAPEPTLTPTAQPEPTATATATNTPTPEPTATPDPTAEPTAVPSPTPEPTSEPAPASVLFGVYPGGGNGELGYVEPPAPETVIGKLNELRGNQTFDIHLYTAWSWYNQQALQHEIDLYTDAGMYVTLTVKYSPPSGREGDIAGFVAFVEQIIDRHASNPMVHRIVVGNEINVTHGNPGSSDGPFAGVNEATIAGVIAARARLDNAGNTATQVGVSLAVLERETDANFLRGLAAQGGPEFRSAVAFMGLNVYPGMWPVGTGDPYADMVTHLENGRYSLALAGFGANVGLAVLENGFPTADAGLQLTKIDGFLRAVCDAGEANGVASYSWFDLWDANSDSDSPYAHYGLLRSDMSAKPSFAHYQNIISNGCGQ